MKSLKIIIGLGLLTGSLALPGTTFAADKATAAEAKNAKPYPLKTCIVSDEALDSMGKPYVFVHEGQEIKLCCKGCLKDFNKEPAKYLKKMAEAEKNAKSAPAAPAPEKKQDAGHQR
jgi:hypothetical protein